MTPYNLPPGCGRVDPAEHCPDCDAILPDVQGDQGHRCSECDWQEEPEESEDL